MPRTGEKHHLAVENRRGQAPSKFSAIACIEIRFRDMPARFPMTAMLPSHVRRMEAKENQGGWVKEKHDNTLSV